MRPVDISTSKAENIILGSGKVMHRKEVAKYFEEDKVLLNIYEMLVKIFQTFLPISSYVGA